MSRQKATYKFTFTDDTAYSIPDAKRFFNGSDQADGEARSLFLTTETNDARIGLGGADPTVGGDGAGHLVKTTSAGFIVDGVNNIKQVSIANATAGQNAVLQITIEYT